MVSIHTALDERAESVLKLFSTKAIDEDWTLSEFRPSETGKWTHSYHRYPAKFIPQLVERLLDEYRLTPAAHVNDPFLGSGTTIVTAISRGMRASGTDVNRLSYLLTKVKSTPIQPDYLHTKTTLLLDRLHTMLTAEGSLFHEDIEPLIPARHSRRLRYWFREQEILQLGQILRVIHEETDECVRDFYLVAFSHILKNCSLWLQGSTKPTRDVAKTPASPHATFIRHLTKMVRGNNEFYRVVPEAVREHLNDYLNIRVGDARCQPVPDESVDIVITSSPYVTSYEYADLHELSTIWLDLVDDVAQYRRDFIGSSYRKYPESELRSAIAKNIVESLRQRSPKMAREVGAFFADMQQVFEESYRILKVGGRCCYVIGNTMLSGVSILNAEVFTECLLEAGFCLDRIIKRRIPSKILPQKRDGRTGRFAKSHEADTEAYPVEYIVVGVKT